MNIQFSIDVNELIAARLVTNDSGYSSKIEFCGVHLEVGSTHVLVFATDRRTMVTFLSRSGHVAGNDSGALAAFFVPSRAVDQLKVNEETKVYFKLLPCGKRYEMICGHTTITLDYGTVPVPPWKKLMREEMAGKATHHLFPVDPELLKNFAAMRPLLYEDDYGDRESDAFPELTIELGRSAERPCRIYLDGIPNFIGLCMPRALREDQVYTSDFIGDEMAVIVKPSRALGERPPSRMFSFE